MRQLESVRAEEVQEGSRGVAADAQVSSGEMQGQRKMAEAPGELPACLGVCGVAWRPHLLAEEGQRRRLVEDTEGNLLPPRRDAEALETASDQSGAPAKLPEERGHRRGQLGRVDVLQDEEGQRLKEALADFSGLASHLGRQAQPLHDVLKQPLRGVVHLRVQA